MSATTITYSAPYIRKDGSVWCMATNHTTSGEIECRMVVDADHPDLPFFWHASAKWDLTEDKPLGSLNRFCCPAWRWGTSADLAHWGAPAAPVPVFRPDQRSAAA